MPMGDEVQHNILNEFKKTVRMILSVLLSVILSVQVTVSAFAAADNSLMETAEYYLQHVAPNNIELNYGVTGELTLSKPMDCYHLMRGYSKFSAYTGKSLSPALDNTLETKMFYIYCDGKPTALMMLSKNTDGIWVLHALGYAASPVIDATEQLQNATSPNEEIAYLFSEPNLYPFTPNLYNGYLAVPNMPSGRMLYQTRDVLIDYYEQTKDWPTFEELLGSDEIPIIGATYATIIPSRHYPVWPFWLMVIGIPVAVIALSVGTVILVRKRKHAK